MSSTSLLSAGNHLAVDQLLTDVYSHYYQGGYRLILLKEVSKVFMLVFSCLLTLLIYLLPWQSILSCHDATQCQSLEAYITTAIQSHADLQLTHLILLVMSILILSQITISCFKVVHARRIKTFFQTSLQVPHEDFDIVSWKQVRIPIPCHSTSHLPQIVSKIVIMQEQFDILHLSYRSVSEYEIVSRIMRRDNYMIALLDTRTIQLDIPLLASSHRFYNKWIEKLVYIVFLDKLFLSNGKLDENFLKSTSTIIFRFRVAGLLSIFAAPILALVLAYSFLLENFQRYYSNRSHLDERDWSPLALWGFREFNEIALLFEKRMKLAYIPTELYVSGYCDKGYTIIGKVICFLSGSIVSVLLILSLIDEDIPFHIHFMNHSLIWYLGTFSIVYAFFRSWTPDFYTRHHNPDKLMAQIVESVHNVPTVWVSKSEANRTRREVSQLFQFRIQLFLIEIFTLLAAPLVLLYSVPLSVPKMVHWVRRFTVTTGEFGDHCGFASMGLNSAPLEPFDSETRR